MCGKQHARHNATQQVLHTASTTTTTTNRQSQCHAQTRALGAKQWSDTIGVHVQMRIKTSTETSDETTHGHTIVTPNDISHRGSQRETVLNLALPRILKAYAATVAKPNT